MAGGNWDARAGNPETRLDRNGMPEREGGGAICDGHALFYSLDKVTNTESKNSAGAG